MADELKSKVAELTKKLQSVEEVANRDEARLKRYSVYLLYWYKSSNTDATRAPQLAGNGGRGGQELVHSC